MSRRPIEPVGEKPSDGPVTKAVFAQHTVEVWAELHPAGTVQDLLEYLRTDAASAADAYVAADVKRYPASEFEEAQAFAREYLRRFNYRDGVRRRIQFGSSAAAT
ncbi:hypothetical protein [Streptomyces telluris]|uniref:Uncharacterized protein n=1 Tax=Streptomyces telluris TaxID=2720021 RepID=A0A9X2RQA5_9ACTN|nr:hypothetical protein [Streptomyces telluris]MCQ8772095.1 hypothetical protein [Streptomyces telluris]NJP82477.1 hypothetical protein [Streptomyces telluris]